MQKFTTRPELIGTFGVVTSTHWLASQSAMAMLEQGGNAYDAAVAGAFVLQVCEPHLNGPLGDVPILIKASSDAEVRVICGQGPAPMAASISALAALGVDLMPESGLLPAVVPGAFDAWMTLLSDYGTFDLATVLAPAIHYAETGIPVLPKIRSSIAARANIFNEYWPTSARAYLSGRTAPEEFSFFKNAELGALFRRLVSEANAAGSRASGIQAARRAWYQGFVAEAIDQFCRNEVVVDETGRAFFGLLTGEDMARWSASYEAPVSIDLPLSGAHGNADYVVNKCGPWSQGPVMLQGLRLLENADITGMDPNGAEFVHTVTEAMKLCYADRDAYYGDPEGVEVPLDQLLSRDYAKERFGLIGKGAALGDRPGEITGHSWRVDFAAAISRQTLADAQAARGGGEPTMADMSAPPAKDGGASPTEGDTCHINIIDKDGNFVSAMPSGGWLMASPVIPGLGCPLGNRLQMVWLDGASPSALRPGLRPRTTLTPTLITRADGSPYLNLGTPGGESQDQWQLIFLLRHLHHGMNLQEAIDAPSFHSEHWPSSFSPRQARPGYLKIESRFGDGVIEELRRCGHDVDVGDAWSEGRLSASSRDHEGHMRAGANPRGMQGYAVGR